MRCSCDDPPDVNCRAKSYSAADHLINPGRSLQQSDGNLTSVEICVSVNSALKHQRCRNVCFWKFASLHPISKIVVHLRPESFLSIRKYASYYRLPLRRRVVGQYLERETLPYLNFRLHWNPLDFYLSAVEQFSCRKQAIALIENWARWPTGVNEFYGDVTTASGGSPTQLGYCAFEASVDASGH